MSVRAARTTCPYCGVGCGVLASRHADGGVTIKGDPNHPANFGRLCSKGAALGETLSLDDRLLYPEISGARVAWDEALDRIATKFSETVAAHGPDSVAFYVSGQILTEDYYVANKLMKGFIGSANIDTNSRLCMASSVAGHKRAFGADTVPGIYEDLELADLVVLVGSNLAWCHPVLYQRLVAARQLRGTKVVVIDPRETATCEIADLHLELNSGSDVALFNGLLTSIISANASNVGYVSAHTSGFKQASAAARDMPISTIARTTGLSQQELHAFYDLFVRTERVVTVYSQGVNQSSTGTDKVNAIINCHLATGRIGKPGMGPFSVTGQPNAMGGRETGGLANMLAAHMELGDPEHRRIVQSFWRAPRLAEKPGLKAVDLFRAAGDGRVKAIWIMATNPVDSMPEADTVRAALAACPLVVVSDVTRHTDTTEMAHVLLPAAAWGEKDGTVTNSERRISRQRAFLPLPGEARPDWWQLAEVAKRMGHAEAFSYRGPAEIFAEYAALTGIENDGRRDLDISAYAGIDPQQYTALTPFQWPQAKDQQPAETRFFANGNFYTPDRRARFVPTPYLAPVQATSARYPLILNTGRVRDQWHTMTRTSKAPRLMAQAPEPVVDVHPADAARFGLAPDAIAEIESAHGKALCRVRLTQGQKPGAIFAPMHWTGQFASLGRIDAVAGAATDPVSGQPELKHTAVAIRPFAAAWYGYTVMRQRPGTKVSAYTVIATLKSGYRVELADTAAPESWDAFARSLLEAGDGEVLAYHDATAGQHRFALFDGDRLDGALFISRTPIAVARTWAAEQLGTEMAMADRLRLLAGRPGAAQRDRGPIVCACFEIGRNEIHDAITKSGARTVAAVGECVKAGTNCGSCRSEIGKLIDDVCLQKAG